MDTTLLFIICVPLGIFILLFIGLNYRNIQRWIINLSKTTINPVLKEKRLAVLKEQFNSIDKYFEEKSREENRRNNDYDSSQNSTCPKCGGKNVTNRIKRVQGNLDGDLYGSSSLFFGSISGSVHGELDTNEVNKCNNPDCLNEWKVKKSNYKWSHTLMEEACDTVYYYFWNINQAQKVEFDKNDLSEKFSSYQEKKAYELSQAINNQYKIGQIKEIWGKYSIELFEYCFEKTKSSLHSDFYDFYKPSLLEGMGIKHIDDFIKH